LDALSVVGAFAPFEKICPADPAWGQLGSKSRGLYGPDAKPFETRLTGGQGMRSRLPELDKVNPDTSLRLDRSHVFVDDAAGSNFQGLPVRDLNAETEPARQRLLKAYERELIDFEHGGMVYTAGAGRFEKGDLAEIFLNTSNNGTAVYVNARDAAVAASFLLQHGCGVDSLCKALTRNSDGSASGPLARALDLLA
jgi:hypothetical protein